MPRPRHDSELLPAKERMRNAFWALLEDREYRKITVTDIVHEAQVNRNSFYYHYGSLSELADDAILQEVENTSIAQLVDETTDDHGIPSMDDDAVREHWHKRISAAINSSEHRTRLNHMALLAGPHSSPELMDSLRDFTRMTLFTALKLDESDMTLRSDLYIDFAVGGILAILRRWPELREMNVAQTLYDDDIAAMAIGLYLSMSGDEVRDSWKRIFRRRGEDGPADQ
ncbi:transcriptional regulator, TetR family [Bifidobacterium pullorum subsp. saeculare DSM 6531 = LMG 14934]|uniref:TetR/AcrR family transcriptional regulator n=2 Tax=Bifidobacterium pullorum TaxID=78448 RepID=A0A921LVS9_9BIFI|nr:TetR/AcrR family transcriptional regulator [Bifidobacterium pullorum]KFI88665.1 transcriptional regulator, TetR family [Bifidobacterium pullorum subsp. saeculare DSM 6531 = LMG 14934]MBE5064520.1 TetR family transcriptional regulator [Bifidobacterium pullorum subsp. saeculare]MBM6692237.1 TetR family transcriptional regulator [Bifidobacterium pullorum subsp. saeculare]MBM6730364.1 TetR family transcriptional regulator [Bifidobacterium pullorum subsp. saeculare]MDM8322556.1 TetR/AcrR family 